MLCHLHLNFGFPIFYIYFKINSAVEVTVNEATLCKSTYLKHCDLLACVVVCSSCRATWLWFVRSHVRRHLIVVLALNTWYKQTACNSKFGGRGGGGKKPYWVVAISNSICDFLSPCRAAILVAKAMSMGRNNFDNFDPSLWRQLLYVSTRLFFPPCLTPDRGRHKVPGKSLNCAFMRSRQQTCS